MKMDEGWVGLILSMMWEAAIGISSKWSAYLGSLPTHFDTPMFWNDEDLAELEGTQVVEKLGRTEAEQLYREKLIPAIQTRPDLFPSEQIPIYYSLDVYHIMGSRILSRSFNVEKWDSGEGEEENPAANTSRGSEMDVDAPQESEGDESASHQDEAEEEDGLGIDNLSDIAMVPIADMLNARYGSENAKLFYEERVLKMVTTRPIKAGEQIWNTYGDLPNAELLRRYGHVDTLLLSDGKIGNPGDVVEIRADIAVSVIVQRHSALSSESSQERIDWWLEGGGDDVFVLESDLELPLELISLVRLLLLPLDEWRKTRDKGKPPKPKADLETLNIIHDVLDRRLKGYPTTTREDEDRLCGEMSLNKKHAIIVRLGEKRLLQGALATINDLREVTADGRRQNKRKGRSDAIAEVLSTKKSRK